jgi:hypothetical protein
LAQPPRTRTQSQIEVGVEIVGLRGAGQNASGPAFYAPSDGIRSRPCLPRCSEAAPVFATGGSPGRTPASLVFGWTLVRLGGRRP